MQDAWFALIYFSLENNANYTQSKPEHSSEYIHKTDLYFVLDLNVQLKLSSNIEM